MLGTPFHCTANQSKEDCLVEEDHSDLRRRSEDVQLYSLDGVNPESARLDSSDSASTWSLAAGSSLDGEPEIRYEGDVRVKRLLWRSSYSGSGPTLRISADADSVLLGRDRSIPAIPALPEHLLESSPQGNLLNSIAGRVSKQILVMKTSASTSRAPTPLPTETPESDSARFLPVGTMQLPHEVSTEHIAKNHDSTGAEASIDMSTKLSEAVFLKYKSRTFTESRAKSELLTHNLDGVDRQAQNEPKAYQTESSGISESVAQRRLPGKRSTPKFASPTSEPTIIRYTTSPLLPSVEHLNEQASPSSLHTSSSIQNRPARPRGSKAGIVQSKPSRLGVTILAEQEGDPILYNTASKRKQSSGHPVEDVPLRIKAKRSFRNMFHRRGHNNTPQPVRKQRSKRSSIAGSVLALRTKGSTNHSEVSVLEEHGSQPSMQHYQPGRPDLAEVSAKDANRQAALSALESDRTITDPKIEPIALHDTATVVHKILDRVLAMTEASPDRLRGLEIAEVCFARLQHRTLRGLLTNFNVGCIACG